METYDTMTLLGVVEGLPKFDPLLLNLFFPDVVTFDTPEVLFDKLAIDESEKLAPFVSPFVAGKPRKEQGFETKTFKPAYVKPMHVVDPARLFTRRPGEPIGGSLTPSQRRDACIAENLAIERAQCLQRFEWMAASAVRTGKVIVEGDDYAKVEVNFGRTAGLTKTLATTARWSETDTSNPPADIEAWDAELDAPSTDVVMSPVAWKYFSAHPKVEKLLDTTLRTGDSALAIAPGTGETVQYKGRLGSKRIWLYIGYYRTDAGVKTPYLAAGEIVLGSAGIRGVRAHGAILDAEAGYMAMEMFPMNWRDRNPSVEYTMTQSAPLMVPRRPNASMCVKVTDAS